MHIIVTLAALMRSVALLLAAFGLASGTSASAQLGAATGAPTHITASLAAESGTPAPGSTSSIAISMVPDATWHGYWVNGGDAGFGLTVRWNLPAGVTVGDFAYPVPQTLMIGQLMNHVYERPYALIAPLTIDRGVAPGTRLTITGTARWLACTDEVCVPESGVLTTTLVAGDGTVNAAERTQFDRWRAALPRPLGSPATYLIDDTRLRIAVPVPASLDLGTPHLFVVQRNVVAAAAPQRFTRTGDTLFIETALAASDRPGAGFDAVLRYADGSGLSFSAAPGEVPPAGEPLATETPANGFDVALLGTALVGALIGGLILNIMPCVFPILSLKALALARGGGDAREVRSEGLAYTAGSVITCLALGTILLLLRAGGEQLGWAFQLQRPESVLLLIILMAAITANLAGLFEFGQVGFGQRLTEAGGAKGAFATGALAAFVATPCSGPFLGAALGATLVLPGWAALPIFAMLGFGLALPFLLIALVPALRARLPRPGAWMTTFRKWLALPMALTVVGLVWLLGRQVGAPGWLIGAAAAITTLLLGWAAGRSQRNGKASSVAFFLLAASIVPFALMLPAVTADAARGPTGALNAEPWSAERVAALRGTGAPLFVYFTADWCVSCKVNETTSIDRADTAAAFRAAGVRTLVADWTNGDAAITRELATHRRNSVPLYLWYPADGSAPEVLPQVLTPGMLTQRAAAVRR